MFKLTAEDFTRRGKGIVIRLTEPEMLGFTYKTGLVGFMSK